MDVKTHHFTRSPSTRVRPIIVYYRDECVLRVLVLMFTHLPFFTVDYELRPALGKTDAQQDLEKQEQQ